MKHLKKINELSKKFDKEKREYIFDPADYPESENVATFYLHKERQGFVLEVSMNDKEQLEEILKRNNINYTLSVNRANILPF